MIYFDIVHWVDIIFLGGYEGMWRHIVTDFHPSLVISWGYTIAPPTGDPAGNVWNRFSVERMLVPLCGYSHQKMQYMCTIYIYIHIVYTIHEWWHVDVCKRTTIFIKQDIDLDLGQDSLTHNHLRPQESVSIDKHGIFHHHTRWRWEPALEHELWPL